MKPERSSWFSHLQAHEFSLSLTLLYAILLFLVIARHEPWADEAQAWLLARDLNLWDLLFKQLRYEGHPGLWYLVLFLPAKLLPYRTISLLSGFTAIVGVFMLLRYAPWPRWLRAGFAFSYFLFYQYAVIARSYVLLPLLVFLLARVYPHKFERTLAFTLLLCLLAFTSVYSALMAIALMAIHLIELIQRRSDLDAATIRRQLWGFVAFGLMLLFIAIQLWPPADGSFARGFRWDLGRFLRLSQQVIDEILTGNRVLSLIVLVLSLVWFWHRRVLLISLLPTLAILGLFAVKYYNSWHQGIPFLCWLFAFWIGWLPLQRPRGPTRLAMVLSKLMPVGLLLVIGFHVFWGVSASMADFRGPYSGGKAVAEYIRDHGLEKRTIYATSFWSTAILPYFDENIFANHNGGRRPAFWRWSTSFKRIEALDEILEHAPDLIILGRPPSDLREIEGYQYVGLFKGNLYWKDGIKENNDFGVFRKR